MSVFRCSEQQLGTVPDPWLGWKALATHVDVHTIEGDHTRMLVGDEAHALQAIRNAMDGSNGG